MTFFLGWSAGIWTTAGVYFAGWRWGRNRDARRRAMLSHPSSREF